jgi:hypothetical protein
LSSFKRLHTSDVFILPYEANKQYAFQDTELADNNILIYTGVKHTGLFDPLSELKTHHVHQKLMYDTINQMFYQQYSGSYIDTRSLSHTPYYESASQYRATASYDNSRIWNDRSLNYPSNSGDHIKVISIPQRLYGQAIKRGTFIISSSDFYMRDDKRGNVYDLLGLVGDYNEDYNDDFFTGLDEDNHIGNIYYSQGLVVITNPNYASLFDEAAPVCSPITGLVASTIDTTVYFAFTGSTGEFLFYNVQLHEATSGNVLNAQKTAFTNGSFGHVHGGDYFVSVQVHCDDNSLSPVVNSNTVTVVEPVLLCPVVTAVTATTPSTGVIEVTLTIPQTLQYGTNCTLELVNSSDVVIASKAYVPGTLNRFTNVAAGTYKVRCIRHCTNGVDSDPVESAPVTLVAPHWFVIRQQP